MIQKGYLSLWLVVVGASACSATAHKEGNESGGAGADATGTGGASGGEAASGGNGDAGATGGAGAVRGTGGSAGATGGAPSSGGTSGTGGGGATAGGVGGNGGGGTGTSWTEQHKLSPSVRAANDRFGISVAVSGDTAFVGATNNDDNGNDAGSAYVFMRTGTSWSERQQLLASDGAEFDYFGHSVAVSGDTAIVGATYDDDSGDDSGSAYVFVGSASWSEQQKLVASDGEANDWFGISVAVSGDTAVVGAPNDDDGGDDSGSAYVFMRTGTSWSEQQKLVASDGETGDNFGYSVAVSGDTAVVGATEDDTRGLDSGSAYVFTRTGASWSEQQELLASDGAEDDYFGYSVAISRDITVVGAHREDNLLDSAGAAYVFVPAP